MINKAWSPIVECKVCSDKYMWGVENNQDFICPKCQEDPDNLYPEAVYPEDDWGAQNDLTVEQYIEDAQWER